MRDTWHSSIKEIIMRAIDEAAAQGVSDVEAEHLLLAVAADPDLPAARVLAGIGWDHTGIAGAFDTERAASLAAAGVGPVDPKILRATRPPARPGWGASAKAAIKNARIGPSKDRYRRTGSADVDLVLAAIEAETGTVPRMLSYAGVDPAALAARLHEGVPA